jgi:CheY-like chemotaxis protein
MAWILVVHHADHQRDLAKHKLGAIGHHVTATPTAQAAWQLAAAHPFDLGLIALDLPGTGGIGAAAGLNADPTARALPLVLLGPDDGDDGDDAAIHPKLLRQAGFVAVTVPPDHDRFAVEVMALLEAHAGVDAQPGSQRPASARPKVASLGVLVVEDDPDTREWLLGRLEVLGYPACAAATGAAAITLARRELPGVVLLGLHLPDLDGWQVARTLRAERATSGAAILVTSEPSTDHPDTGVVDGWLVKPFRTSDLVHALTRYVGPPPALISSR